MSLFNSSTLLFFLKTIFPWTLIWRRWTRIFIRVSKEIEINWERSLMCELWGVVIVDREIEEEWNSIKRREMENII